MRKMLLVLTICGIVAGPVGSASAATPLATTEARLRAIGLSARDVALPHTATDHGLAIETSWFCETQQPSDRYRIARIQDDYVRRTKNVRTSPLISTEVVVYKHGGANLAIGEFRAAPTRCPRHTDSVATKTLRVLRPSTGAVRESVLLVESWHSTTDVDKYQYILAQRYGDVVAYTYLVDYSDFQNAALLDRLTAIEAGRLRRLAAGVAAP